MTQNVMILALHWWERDRGGKTVKGEKKKVNISHSVCALV
jgi:hypothetical protein